MLSVYASSGSIVEETNLKKLFDLLVKKTKPLIKSAAIVYGNGHVAVRTNSFKISDDNFSEIKRTFLQKQAEMFSFHDVTYCIKSKSTNQMVGFNGSNYVIISKTPTTFIIVTCSNKQKQCSLSAWVENIAGIMRDRHI